MNTDELNLLHKKAKTRKDGIYSFKGNYWVVKNNCFVVFADYYGDVYQRYGNFNVKICKIERRDSIKWLKDNFL